MDLKQLEAYIAVVTCKSFTIAAEKLGVSQPTISIQIQKLEEELKSTLLIRTRNKFTLTPRGEEFFDCARNMVKLRDDVLDRWNGVESRVIHMGVSTVPSAYILPKVLPGFLEQHGEVSFAVDQQDSQEILRRVSAGTYDLGLVGMKEESDTLEFERFCEDRMVLITPANEKYKKWAKDGTRSLTELLLTEPVILREQGSGSGKTADAFLDSLGLSEERLHVAARINDQEAMKNLVAGGLGIAILSDLALANAPENKGLLRFELPEDLPSRSFFIVYQKNYILKPYVQEMIQYLRTYDQGGKRNDPVTGKL